MCINKTRWIDRLYTAALLLVLLVAYGVAGRMDFEDEVMRQEAGRQVRQLVAAVQWCGPKPGQRAVQEWRDGRLVCSIFENNGYGRTPRIVAHLEIPQLDHPLAKED